MGHRLKPAATFNLKWRRRGDSMGPTYTLCPVQGPERNTRIGPCEHGKRKYPRTGERSAFFRFRLFVIVWFREH